MEWIKRHHIVIGLIIAILGIILIVVFGIPAIRSCSNEDINRTQIVHKHMKQLTRIEFNLCSSILQGTSRCPYDVNIDRNDVEVLGDKAGDAIEIYDLFDQYNSDCLPMKWPARQAQSYSMYLRVLALTRPQEPKLSGPFEMAMPDVGKGFAESADNCYSELKKKQVNRDDQPSGNKK